VTPPLAATYCPNCLTVDPPVCWGKCREALSDDYHDYGSLLLFVDYGLVRRSFKDKSRHDCKIGSQPYHPSFICFDSALQVLERKAFLTTICPWHYINSICELESIRVGTHRFVCFVIFDGKYRNLSAELSRTCVRIMDCLMERRNLVQQVECAGKPWSTLRGRGLPLAEHSLTHKSRNSLLNPSHKKATAGVTFEGKTA
jgi:hypothetical protein